MPVVLCYINHKSLQLHFVYFRMSKFRFRLMLFGEKIVAKHWRFFCPQKNFNSQKRFNPKTANLIRFALNKQLLRSWRKTSWWEVVRILLSAAPRFSNAKRFWQNIFPSHLSKKCLSNTLPETYTHARVRAHTHKHIYACMCVCVCLWACVFMTY